MVKVDAEEVPADAPKKRSRPKKPIVRKLVDQVAFVGESYAGVHVYM